MIKIIGEHIPTLEALQLSHNKLRTLDGFEKLVTAAPNVKILYVSDNNVSRDNACDVTMTRIHNL